MSKPKKVHSQVRIQKNDLKDLIRDEIYGASMCEQIHEIIFIRASDVAKIAKKIANRCIIGH